MKNFYYIKANIAEWYDDKKNYDWDILEKGKEVSFYTYHKKRDYWLEIRKGDIIVCHSSYLNVGTLKTPKFIPKPRITAISIITSSRHLLNGEEVVSIRKVIHLPRPVFKNEIDNDPIISESEPFAKGSNRYTITKLKKEEYSRLKDKILGKNPEFKNGIEELEN